MSGKLKVAIAGLAHVHAIGFYGAFKKYPDEVDFIGLTDIPDAKGAAAESLESRLAKNFRTKGPMPRIFGSLDELLAEKPDLICIGSDIADHAAVAVQCLQHGVNTVIEKPMALKIQDGIRMLDAARKSTASLFVNWPIAWFPAFNVAKQMVDDGKIGRPLRVVYRSPATKGPYCSEPDFDPQKLGDIWWYRHDRGGGSLADYSGYSFTLATWFLKKMAKTVYGLRKNFLMPFTDVEDYSDFIIDFGDAVAQAEGSWSTFSSGEIPTGPIIYGSEGTIVCDRFTSVVKVYKTFKPYVQTPPPEEVVTPPPMPDLNLARQMIDFIRDGKPVHEMITLEFNLKQLAALDAGVRSCDSGCAEAVINPFA
ncbi:MAG: Gfo/Idh/MocA family oxidoreductase [Victivallales bacterium]|nr:Gfo/Idh/MocA family oxidoreductase [Victivallales bacterium]